MHRKLLNYLHLVRSGNLADSDRAKLDAARHLYLESYFDVQMLISDEVLRAAGRANDGLSRAYGMARRLDSIPSADAMTPFELADETVESTFSYLEEVRQRIADARNIMRSELGLTGG